MKDIAFNCSLNSQQPRSSVCDPVASEVPRGETQSREDELHGKWYAVQGKEGIKVRGESMTK